MTIGIDSVQNPSPLRLSSTWSISCGFFYSKV